MTCTNFLYDDAVLGMSCGNQLTSRGADPSSGNYHEHLLAAVSDRHCLCWVLLAHDNISGHC